MNITMTLIIGVRLVYLSILYQFTFRRSVRFVVMDRLFKINVIRLIYAQR